MGTIEVLLTKERLEGFDLKPNYNFIECPLPDGTLYRVETHEMLRVKCLEVLATKDKVQILA